MGMGLFGLNIWSDFFSFLFHPLFLAIVENSKDFYGFWFLPAFDCSLHFNAGVTYYTTKKVSFFPVTLKKGNLR